MNAFFVISVLSFVCGSTFAEQALPDFLHICKKNDPALQECFKQSVLTLKPYLAKGVPEHKIPKLEPLLLKELLVAEPAGAAQTVSISVNNIKVYGCTDFDIKNINIDFDHDRADFELLFQQIYIDGTYDISGKIILLPVRGNGQIVGNFTRCVGDCRIETEKVKRDGKEYLHVKSMDLKLQVKQGKVHLYNLFGGVGPLGDVINSVINQNFDAFSKELFPALERELSKLFLPMVNSIVSQYSYDVLFPAS